MALPKWLTDQIHPEAPSEAPPQDGQEDATEGTPKSGKGARPPRIYILMMETRKAVLELRTTKAEKIYAENSK